MEDNWLNYNVSQPEKSISDYIAAIMRRKWVFLSIFFSVSIISIVVALVLPALYKSSAVILIEQQEIPEDLVRSTVTSFADQRIQVISQRVMTSANLKKIIDKYNLYEEDQKDEPLEVILDKMREDISLDMISADVLDPITGRAAKATIAFSLSYENSSSRSAQKVTNEIVTLFLDENLRNRVEMAKEAHDFLLDEANQLDKMVNELEKELAEFKEKNTDSLPDMVRLNLEFLSRQERELSEVKRQIQSLNGRKIYLESELNQISPHEEHYSETGQRILGPKDKLKSVESEYLSLLSRYSAEHPDVIKLEKEKQSLESEVGHSVSNKEIMLKIKIARIELAQLKEKYSAEHPDIKQLMNTIELLEAKLKDRPLLRQASLFNGKPDNPAYLRVKTELDAARAEIASLQEKSVEITEKISDYEMRLSKSPEVERVYRSLLRDYENAVVKFREVKAKQMEAQLAKNLESEKKAERFTLIEPPVEPVKPYSPNRIALLTLGVLFAFTLGIGAVLSMDYYDKGIYGKKALQNIYGENPLSMVPYIETRHDIKMKWIRYISFSLILLLVLVSGLSLTHVYISPLDILWIVINRKLGID